MTQSIVLKYKDFVGNTLEVKCICTVTARTLLFDFMLKWDKIHMARIHDLEDNRNSKNGWHKDKQNNCNSFQSNEKPIVPVRRAQQESNHRTFYIISCKKDGIRPEKNQLSRIQKDKG